MPIPVGLGYERYSDRNPESALQVQTSTCVRSRSFRDLATTQLTAAATTPVMLPATSAGVRLGSNGAGSEYSMPTGLIQTTG